MSPASNHYMSFVVLDKPKSCTSDQPRQLLPNPLAFGVHSTSHLVTPVCTCIFSINTIKGLYQVCACVCVLTACMYMCMLSVCVCMCVRVLASMQLVAVSFMHKVGFTPGPTELHRQAQGHDSLDVGKWLLGKIPHNDFAFTRRNSQTMNWLYESGIKWWHTWILFANLKSSQHFCS